MCVCVCYFVCQADTANDRAITALSKYAEDKNDPDYDQGTNDAIDFIQNNVSS